MNDVTKAYWTDAHKKYSDNGWVMKPTLFAENIRRFLPLTGTLLELGAGQGQDSRFFAKNGFEVTSTDLTPHPLELSKQFAEKEGLQIIFQEVDIAKELPFTDGTFDVVYSHLALHYFDAETTRKVFGEIHRVLKPAGIFAALFNTVDDEETRRSDFVEIEKDFYRIPLGIHKRFFSVDSLQQFTQELFDPMVIDAQGTTYKDPIDTLIRFVGRKK